MDELDNFRIRVSFDSTIGKEKFELHVESSRIVYVKEQGKEEEPLELERERAKYKCSGVCDLRIVGHPHDDELRFVPLCGTDFSWFARR